MVFNEKTFLLQFIKIFSDRDVAYIKLRTQRSCIYSFLFEQDILEQCDSLRWKHSYVHPLSGEKQ